MRIYEPTFRQIGVGGVILSITAILISHWQFVIALAIAPVGVWLLVMIFGGVFINSQSGWR